MKHILFAFAMLALCATATFCAGQQPVRSLQMVKAGADSLGRDSVYIIATERTVTEHGWVETSNARLFIGKSEARQFLKALEDDAESQKTRLDEVKAQREAERQSLRALRLSKLADSPPPPLNGDGKRGTKQPNKKE